MGFKAFLKRLIAGPGGLRPRRIRLGLLSGLRFHINTDNKSQRLIGLDEREVAATLRRFARLARLAVDVGASDGYYSLFFASRPCVTRVFAFEPNFGQITALRNNFALNSPAFADKLQIVARCVGSRDDGGWCRLDDVISPDANRTYPLLLKIDVDGGEADVLEGARRILQSGQCFLVVETHSTELERRCIALLDALGYRTEVVPNGWYRFLVPEHRPIPHNRWLVAQR